MGEAEERLVTRLQRFVATAQALGTHISPIPEEKGENMELKETLLRIKSELHTAMLALPLQSLERASISLLETTVSLAVEDLGLTGHGGNSLVYIDHCLSGLQSLPGTNFFITLEHLSKTEASVRARKMNISNRLPPGDTRSNFLNRLEGVTAAVSVLRKKVVQSLGRPPRSIHHEGAPLRGVLASGRDTMRLGLAQRLLVAGFPHLTDTEYDDDNDEEEELEEEELGLLLMEGGGLLLRPRQGSNIHSCRDEPTSSRANRGPGFL